MNFILVTKLLSGLWVPVERSVEIPHDLEATPIEVKMDAKIGEDKSVDVLFYDSNENYIGQLYFGFSTPEYKIYKCAKKPFQANFPVDVAGADTMIAITKTKNSGGTSTLAMFYNDVRVVNYELSAANGCSEGSYGDVEKIEFYQFDDGEKFYRIIPINIRK